MNSMTASPSGPASPCIGVCSLDPRSGHCLGCGRSRSEIAAWGGADGATRRRMWQDSDARAAALGLPLRLVDRSPDQILDWAAWTLDASAGTWVLGAPGATAELVRSSAEPCYTHRDGHRLEGQTPRAAFRLDAAADLRAFQWIDAYAGAGAPAERTVLTAPLDDGWQPCHTITPLGADLAAVIPAARTQHLVDLGVGGPAARFCIRTGEAFLGNFCSAS